jgi:hypothetical protein
LAQRRINEIGVGMFKFNLFEAVEEVDEGGAEAVAGASAVVGAFGGGVTEEAVGGAAEVDVEGPVEVAGAERGDVVGPLGGGGEFEHELAEEGIGVGLREAVGVGVGDGELVLGAGVESGAVAPVVGAGGAVAFGIECGLHGVRGRLRPRSNLELRRPSRAN